MNKHTICYRCRAPWSILGLGLLLCFAACRDQQQLSIPEEKMVAVMADMHLAEAALQSLPQNVKDTLSQQYYDQIYRIHQIEEEQYLDNLEFLETRPKMAKKIYDEVLEKISELENEEP